MRLPQRGPSQRRGVTFRVLGVSIRLDLSFVLLVGLVFWSLADVVFPTSFTDLSLAAVLVLAAVGTVLLVGSVLVHELCHSVQSRREGAPVHGITLWLLGGVSEIEEPLRTPAAEFRVVAAGPAASGVLAAVFGLATYGGYRAGLPDPVVTVLMYVAWSNALLLAFNVVPALPLDGGRLLHALLWWRSRDRYRATVHAGAVGQVLAVALMALGVVALAGRDTAVTGVWTVLIGGYLLVAARREVAAARDALVLHHALAADVVPAGSTRLDPTTTLADVTDLLYDHPAVTALPVVDGRQQVGTLLVREAGKVPIGSRRDVAAWQVMHHDGKVMRISGKASAWDLTTMLRESADPAAVMVLSDEGDVVGAVTTEDVEHFLESHRSSFPSRKRS